MSQFNIINLNDFTWQLNIAIFGAAFAALCLIYDPSFIAYGFITFAYGVVGHVFDKLLNVFIKENDKNYWLVHLLNLLLVIVWITISLSFY